MLRGGPRWAIAVVPCVAYACASASMTLLNKAAVAGAVAPPLFFLQFSQHLTTATLTWTLHALGVFRLDGVSSRTFWRWVPLNFLFVGMLLTNMNACVCTCLTLPWLTSVARLRYVSIPMVTVFKAFSTVATGLGDYFFFKQPLSVGIVGSLVTMVR
eukprot:TRINITY_DN1583_c0_g1_i2.p1 TRINITY_DN1583_c0_g1~~TRINITY_DN1583_c0_g1_i2.p1  ORF type:complete len:157 (-),score=33.16 TRINITY_DN1583_c0_g1_i2:617-1087(-)